MESIRNNCLPIVAIAIVFSALAHGQAFAQNQPNKAVSETNYKAGLLGGAGSGNVENSVALTGLWATPIGQNYGFQLDGYAGSTKNSSLFSIAVHGFKRDWEKGFVGLYGSIGSGTNGYSNHGPERVDGSGKPIVRLGLEGSRYLGDFNLGGIIGLEHDHQLSDTRFFDKLGVDYYLTENFKAGIFHQYTNHQNGVGLGFEYLARSSSDKPVSIYGQVVNASGAPTTFNIGIRVLFGAAPNRNLRIRDRHDYVPEFMPQPLRKYTKIAQLEPVAAVAAAGVGNGSGGNN